MAENNTFNEVMDEAELQAAMAELEALTRECGPADGIPDPDVQQPEHVVPVPVEVPAPNQEEDTSENTPPANETADNEVDTDEPGEDSEPVSPSSAKKDTSGIDEACDRDETAHDAPAPGFLRKFLGFYGFFRGLFRRRKRRAEPTVSKVSGSPAAPTRPRMNIILRVLDLVLDLVNRPFAFLSPTARHWLGVASVATLVVSVVSALAFPRLFPRRDAFSFLQEKKAELILKSSPAGGTGDAVSEDADSPDK